MVIFQLQDCGMVLEEQPAKIVEAFRLFLQGHGYGMYSSLGRSSLLCSSAAAFMPKTKTKK